jgi:hypothetical protein
MRPRHKCLWRTPDASAGNRLVAKFPEWLPHDGWHDLFDVAQQETDPLLEPDPTQHGLWNVNSEDRL